MFLFSYLKTCLENKNWNEVARVKEELRTMFLVDSMGVIIRSRYQQNAEEERGSLFHAARESRNDKNNLKKQRDVSTPKKEKKKKKAAGK